MSDPTKEPGGNLDWTFAGKAYGESFDHWLDRVHPLYYEIEDEGFRRCPTCEEWSPCDVRKGVVALVEQARAGERERVAHSPWDEIQRLRMALQVCEHTLHLQNPSMEDLHAGSYASSAWVNGSWQPYDVEEDLPSFGYRDDPRDPPLDGAS